ncbi:unnamed protein product [Hydatigera taeniaeformis]|uniref:Uncharacterized protein n=1 Tax=Hydatigena taeniaeformis TaxID=6205 RepID=A0A0R3WNX1_HYDTA|nr:unnamed protein product [Hydatigera taeniaeformis]
MALLSVFDANSDFSAESGTTEMVAQLMHHLPSTQNVVTLWLLNVEFSPHHIEEHYYFRGGSGGGSVIPISTPLERWRCIGGRREANTVEASTEVGEARPPPPPPPPKPLIHRTSLPPLSDQGDFKIEKGGDISRIILDLPTASSCFYALLEDVAPKLPSRTSCPPRSQVSSPTTITTAFGVNLDWNPPPLPPKKKHAS